MQGVTEYLFLDLYETAFGHNLYNQKKTLKN